MGTKTKAKYNNQYPIKSILNKIKTIQILSILLLMYSKSILNTST